MATTLNHQIINATNSSRSELPPVLMLHGWGQSLNGLVPLGELLASERKVILLDLPGFGKSELPEGDWDTRQYAERVVKFLDENQISTVVTLGHSFGGRVSLRLASEFPDRIKGLVLIGSHGLQRQRSFREQMRIKLISLLGKLAKVVERISGKKVYSEQFRQKFGSVDYRNAGALRGTLVKTVIEDQTSNAAQISAPTLLLWGLNDLETPPELGRRFNRLIKGSKLILLPAKGHYPHHEIGAHLCAYYIRDFLAGVRTDA